jgi:hypothetical protein
MLNLVSILIGLVALIGAVIAFIPLLGWLYWAVIPIAIVGLAVGAMSSHNAGRNLNLVVVIVGAARLIIGHGIF